MPGVTATSSTCAFPLPAPPFLHQSDARPLWVGLVEGSRACPATSSTCAFPLPAPPVPPPVRRSSVPYRGLLQPPPPARFHSHAKRPAA